MHASSLDALAKINLALHVGPLQPDGYHPVDTLCVFAPAGDRLAITGPASDFSLTIVGNQGTMLSAEPDNLILRAARLYQHANPISPVQFHLEKHVPVASGIGGGTSNGVVALILLNQLAELPLPADKLLSLSEHLGADGPVCLAPHVYGHDSFRARGIGFEVTAGPGLPPLWICLANPLEIVPTGPVFKRFDATPPPMPFDLSVPARLTSLIELQSFIASSRNDLAAPAEEICSAITNVHEQLSDQPGCIAARMSGSGATVFGLFSSPNAARRAAQSLKAKGHWAVSAPLHRSPSGLPRC